MSDPSRVYNGDETNFILCPKNTKVIVLKQYLPNKPKLYVLCDLMGYAHKFEVYSEQENSGKLSSEPDLGAIGNVVVRLLRGVPRRLNHIKPITINHN